MLFRSPGFSYIDFIYGAHYCLNFVTEPEGRAAAVLLRAAEPVEGIEIMRARSTSTKINRLLNGPGKFCRAFGLNREQNNLDLTGGILYLEDRSFRVAEIGTSARIGIRTATDRPWRFYDKNAASVSRTG